MKRVASGEWRVSKCPSSLRTHHSSLAGGQAGQSMIEYLIIAAAIITAMLVFLQSPADPTGRIGSAASSFVTGIQTKLGGGGE